MSLPDTSTHQNAHRPGSRSDISGHYRKVIKIKAEDSPNVRKALRQIEQGIIPTGELVIPGVLSWKEYQKRRKTWDKVMQSVGLDAEFWEGAEILMYPPEWLNRAERLARLLRGVHVRRQAKSIGADPAEGGDKTAVSVIDEFGLMEQTAIKIPDTSKVAGILIDTMRRHDVSPENVVLDRGGGGKQIADQLRSRGFMVRTVAFGEPVTQEVKKGTARVPHKEKVEQKEERYAYKNRRSQMYGEFRRLLDPGDDFDISMELGFHNSQIPDWSGFAIPAKFRELRRQLSLMPLLYDDEGRMLMLPKSKKNTRGEKSLIQILGCSPDESDSLVLAIHGLLHRSKSTPAGAMTSVRSRRRLIAR